MKVALISCGKKKANKACQAKDLYISPRFKKAVELAKKAYDAYFILSALHGLVPPDVVLEPYNLTLNDFNRDDATNWAWRVTGQINEQVPGGAQLHFLCGKAYFAGLGRGLEAYSLHYPLKGMKPGFVLQWLNKQLDYEEKN